MSNAMKDTAAKWKKLTWKEFIDLVEAAGVTGDDEIDSIDITWEARERFTCFKDEDFGWQIKL